MRKTMNDDDRIEMTALQLRNALMDAWIRGIDYGKQCTKMDRMIKSLGAE